MYTSHHHQTYSLLSSNWWVFYKNMYQEEKETLRWHLLWREETGTGSGKHQNTYVDLQEWFFCSRRKTKRESKLYSDGWECSFFHFAYLFIFLWKKWFLYTRFVRFTNFASGYTFPCCLLSDQRGITVSSLDKRERNLFSWEEIWKTLVLVWLLILT